MKLLIANGYVIDPAQQLNAGGRSLLIEDGRVVGLLDRGEPVPRQQLPAVGPASVRCQTRIP